MQFYLHLLQFFLLLLEGWIFFYDLLLLNNIAYIGKNRWKRCVEENPEALDEIIEKYLLILREEILRLEYSKELFDRDMNMYAKNYMEILKKH